MINLVLTANETYRLLWLMNHGAPQSYSMSLLTFGWPGGPVAPAGSITQRRITFSNPPYAPYETSLDLLLQSPETALVEIGQKLNLQVNVESYSDPIPPPPPVVVPPAPSYETTIIDATHIIETDKATGKSRKCTQTPFGWSVTDWA